MANRVQLFGQYQRQWQIFFLRKKIECSLLFIHDFNNAKGVQLRVLKTSGGLFCLGGGLFVLGQIFLAKAGE